MSDPLSPVIDSSASEGVAAKIESAAANIHADVDSLARLILCTPLVRCGKECHTWRGPERMGRAKALADIVATMGRLQELVKPREMMARTIVWAILCALLLALCWLGYYQPGMLLEFANLRYCG